MYEKYVGIQPQIAETVRQVNEKQSFLQNLAKKYANTYARSSLSDEIERFELVNGYVDDDLLSWWASVGLDKFPILSKLARIILQLSATSAVVERLNSIAGSTLSKQRMNMSHQKAEKIMFVHYNYSHVQNHFNSEN